MRFRLPTSGAGGQSLEGGISNLFNAFAMAPLLQAQAAEGAETAGMRRQVMQSQIADHIAKAALQAQERQQLAGRPDVLTLMGATRAGMSVPEFKAGINERTYGAPAEGPALLPQPIPGVGPSGRTAGFDDAITTLYGPAMASPANHTNWDQLAEARGRYQTQDVLDQVLAGRTNAGQAGQAVAASKGGKIIDNIGNTGAGFNQFTGDGVTLNPGMLELFGKEGVALVNQRNSAAGASGAAARLSTARKDRVVGGYDKPVTVLDEDTGDATVTRLPTGGDPVSVGVAAGKKTGVDATNAKARNQVVAAVEREMGKYSTDAEIQAEVDRRMARRGSAAPAAAPAVAPAAGPKIDMDRAGQVRADFKAGKLTREQAQAKLKALGFQ